MLENIVDWLRGKVVELSEFIRMFMLLALAFEWVHWTDAQQAILLAVISAGLSLITSKQTIPSVKMDAIVDKAMERRDAQ